MPSTSTLAAFAAAAFVLIAVPGPNMIYLVARSLSEGRHAGVLSALGIETGTLVHTAAAAVGLSALLASSATAFAVVKYAGAAYLVYLGLRALLTRSSGELPEPAAPVGGGHVYRQAMLTQLLNPKVAIFFLAFLPQFIDSSRAAAPQILVLGGVLAVMGLAIGAATALAAGTLAQRLRARAAGGRPWGRWASGSVYLALGAYAALSPGQRTS